MTRPCHLRSRPYHPAHHKGTERMARFSVSKLFAALAIVGAIGATPLVNAQQPGSQPTPQISPPAAAAAKQEALTVERLSPAARAAIATRLTGSSVPLGAISGTMTVSPDAPVFRVGGAPRLTLSAVRADWRVPVNGTRPSISLPPMGREPDTPSTRVYVEMTLRATAGQRYLVVCDMGPSGALWHVTVGGRDTPITWEATERAAMLLSPLARDGDVTMSFRLDPIPPSASFSTGGSIKRCEVSPIRI